MKTVDFSETIAGSDLKVGICRQLIRSRPMQDRWPKPTNCRQMKKYNRVSNFVPSADKNKSKIGQNIGRKLLEIIHGAP